jgi:hypothetical protein
MTDEPRHSPPDWTEEEGINPAAQEGMRSDIGASMQRPREEDAKSPDRIEPTGQRGPAGAGEVPGRGKLGSTTPGEEGIDEAT